MYLVATLYTYDIGGEEGLPVHGKGFYGAACLVLLRVRCLHDDKSHSVRNFLFRLGLSWFGVRYRLGVCFLLGKAVISYVSAGFLPLTCVSCVSSCVIGQGESGWCRCVLRSDHGYIPWEGVGCVH